MTKRDWESSLVSGIKKLPQSEIDKVLDYYSEIFFDKMESGKSEIEILKEFGNPYDVAYKIYYDHEMSVENNGAKRTVAVDEMSSEIRRDDCDREDNFSVGTTIDPQEQCVEPQTNGSSDHIYNSSGKNEQHSVEKSTLQSIGLKILFFVPYVVIMITIWSIIFSFGVSAVCLCGCGVFGIFASFVVGASSVFVVVTYVGGSIFMVGLGLLLLFATYYMAKISLVPTVRYFYKGKHIKY